MENTANQEKPPSTFNCPICRKVGIRSNSIEVEPEAGQRVCVCWPCAVLCHRTVERAQEDIFSDSAETYAHIKKRGPIIAE